MSRIVKRASYIVLALAFCMAVFAELVANRTAHQATRIALQASEYIDGPGLLRKCDQPPSCMRGPDGTLGIRYLPAEQINECIEKTKAACAAQIAARVGTHE